MNNLTPKGSGQVWRLQHNINCLAIRSSRWADRYFYVWHAGTSISGASSSLAGTWGDCRDADWQTTWRLLLAQSIGGRWTGGLGMEELLTELCK